MIKLIKKRKWKSMEKDLLTCERKIYIFYINVLYIYGNNQIYDI